MQTIPIDNRWRDSDDSNLRPRHIGLFVAAVLDQARVRRVRKVHNARDLKQPLQSNLNAHQMHGKERKKFRSECKKGGGKPQ